jgi:type IV secretory pathway protease TraF
MPYGLYQLTAVRAPLTRGAVVVLPVPASVHPWHWRWLPLLKPIAGLAGDTVCNRDHTLYVNSTPYGPIYQSAHGKPLPQLDTGCVVVPEAHVFLASPAPKSLDSRYIGAVPIVNLTAQATPLLTWR